MKKQDIYSTRGYQISDSFIEHVINITMKIELYLETIYYLLKNILFTFTYKNREKEKSPTLYIPIKRKTMNFVHPSLNASRSSNIRDFVLLDSEIDRNGGSYQW